MHELRDMVLHRDTIKRREYWAALTLARATRFYFHCKRKTTLHYAARNGVMIYGIVLRCLGRVTPAELPVQPADIPVNAIAVHPWT